VFFYAHGYSTPLDTIKNQNCPNGLWIQVNGEFRCIDTTILYHPLPKPWNELYQNYYHDKMKSLTWKQLIFEGLNELSIYYYYRKMKSLNLQLLEEQKWYNEDIQEDRFRIFLIEYPPSYDSIVLFSLIKQDQNLNKLIKKEMPVYYYYEPFLPDSNYFLIDSCYYLLPEYGYVFPDSSSYSDSSSYYIKESSVVTYKQTESIISEKKLQKLTKQLNKLINCEACDRYGEAFFVIEYIFKGDYYLFIAMHPKYWCRVIPESLEVKGKYPKKSGLKIMKWLSEY